MDAPEPARPETGAADAGPPEGGEPESPALPAEFYRGRARARRATFVAGVVIVGLLAGTAAAGVIDLGVLFGPHVARSEWAFAMTGARELNARGLTGRGITVCIVDSGLDDLHPDLARMHLVAWKDFVSGRPEPYDDSGHGTAMAGLIVANGSLVGVAPEVRLIAAKVVDATGQGTSSEVAAGIRFCADPFGNGTGSADIISVSLGSKAPLFVATEVSDAAAWATSRGIFVVAAAGNDGRFDDGDVEIPANVPLAIAVGAVDATGRLAPFSSMGSSLNRTDPNLKPEVVAPGVQLVSTAPGAHYVTTTGTSPATALAAGVLALLLQAHPELRPHGTSANVVSFKMALMAGAIKAASQVRPHDPWYGYGIFDGIDVLPLL